jgi:signal transduction histidine kinase
MFVISWVLILLTRLAFDYEKRLLFAQDKIQQNLNFKNRIVGMISHEIRSPLNIISIYSRIISKQIQDESLKESFKNIDFTTNSLLLLTNQILEYSKNENVKLKLNEKDFNLNTELSEIFKGLTTLVKSNGNNLIIESNLKKDVVVHSDAVKIQQLFYNIVGNSNKFTKKGFINILINTEKTTDNRINLLVEISDNGIGIDNNDLKNIFENYYQGVVSEDMQNLGAGLGLNLCKELIELFDGKINVTSKKNKGTSVFFNILLNTIKY